MARPKSEKYNNIADKLEDYVENTELPIIAEFCVINHIVKQRLYQLAQTDERLFDSIKRCVQKKEVELERGTLTGKYTASMGIFSLKQLGWRDAPELPKDNNNESDGFIDALKGDVKETFEKAGEIVEE